MSKNDLRVSKNISELSKDIKSILGGDETFTIWQNINGDKQVLPGVISSQFLSSSELTLEFEIEDGSLIQPKVKVFMFCEDKSMLLKGRVKLISTTKLKVLIDHKFYLKEKRTVPRLDLSDREIQAQIDRKIELKDRVKSEDVKVKNISNFGCGFYITSSRAIFFQPGSEITLKSLGGVPFNGGVNGTITHVTPVDVNFDSNKLMLVGIKFADEYKNVDLLIQEAELASVSNTNNMQGKTIG